MPSRPNIIIISFRGSDVPVTHPNISKDVAEKAIESSMFQRWIKRSEKIIDRCTISLRGVEIQSVDMVGGAPGLAGPCGSMSSTSTIINKRVVSMKIKADAYLISNGREISNSPLPGVTLLKGDAVGILMGLNCEDGKKYTILVEQPRIPMGTISCMEIPEVMIHQENGNDGFVEGTAILEMEEECGIKLQLSDLNQMKLTTTNKQKYSTSSPGNSSGGGGGPILPMPGGCDESIDLYYVEKKVTVAEMERMYNRIAKKHKDNNSTSSNNNNMLKLHVVPFDDAWKLTGDAKLICAMFLYQKHIEEEKRR